MRRMHVVLVTSLAVLTVVSLHGQTVTPRVERVESDMVKLVAPSGLEDTELRGRRLFVQRCAYCHERRGEINIGADRIEESGDTTVRERILEGLPRQMPGFQYTLDVEQVNQIIAFLKTVT
jgi:mono/diheme cytochrome c family protein